jgi:hypothetical protein
MELKEIKGLGVFDGMYLVSSNGDVYSKDRIVKSGNYSYFKKGRKLVQTFNKKQGYYFVCLSVDKKRKNISVHKLVANAFLGHIPCGYEITVDHIDENKKNNNCSNLRLMSSVENVRSHFINKNKKIGVCYNKGMQKYQSRIAVNKKRYFLGYFDLEEDAIKAYQEAFKEKYNKIN